VPRVLALEDRQVADSELRRAGFARAVESAGFPCRVYPAPAPEEAADYSREAPRLAAWLKSLPPQTALYTVKDIRGQQILAACLDAGIAVPDTLAVLSTDDDEVLCETATPALSSIALDGAYTGRICAKALDDLLHGRKRHPLVDIAFPRIVTRRSTDAFAITDPVLARVIATARQNLSAPSSPPSAIPPASSASPRDSGHLTASSTNDSSVRLCRSRCSKLASSKRAA
jgi:LacI family transcriptional regulator